MTKYFNFNGLASRSEYWGAQILGFIAFMVALLVSFPVMAFSVILGLALMISSIGAYLWLVLSTVVRRCNDAGINPFWTAGCFLPYVGFVVWVVIGVLPSTTKNV